jgi:hypothetical protein
MQLAKRDFLWFSIRRSVQKVVAVANEHGCSALQRSQENEMPQQAGSL